MTHTKKLALMSLTGSPSSGMSPSPNDRQPGRDKRTQRGKIRDPILSQTPDLIKQCVSLSSHHITVKIFSDYD